METIKVGDIVRVSDKIPQFYRKYNSMRMFEQAFRVVDIEDGLALLVSTPALVYKVMLPLKYLVKVKAAEKPKYKIGQWVEMPDGDVAVITNVDNSSSHPYSLFSVKKEDVSYDRWSDDDLKPYTEPKEPTIKVGDKLRDKRTGRTWTAKLVEGDLVAIADDGSNEIPPPYVELIQDANAEELAEPLDFKKVAEDWTATISNGIREYGENTCRIMEEGSVEAYWDVYTADLAKEIVLKIAGSQLHNHKTQEIGRMAVEIAKSVVDNLKKREE